MPELNRDMLQQAMKAGCLICSYEPEGSGNAKAPTVRSISIDHENHTINIESDDATVIEWISGTHLTNESDPSTRQSTIVGLGKTFDYSNFANSYVRARLVNDNGETAVQPFGFVDDCLSSIGKDPIADRMEKLTVTPNPASDIATFNCTEPMIRVTLLNSAGAIAYFTECAPTHSLQISVDNLAPDLYIAVVATDNAAYTAKVLVK